MSSSNPTKDKAKKQYHRMTISFCPTHVNVPMNRMIHQWEAKGEKPASKMIESLIEMDKINQSSQGRKFKNIFAYVYNTLASAYDVDSEEFLVALDDLLKEIIVIDSNKMIDLVQEKVEEKTIPNYIPRQKPQSSQASSHSSDQGQPAIEMVVEEAPKKPSLSKSTISQEAEIEIKAKESKPKAKLTVGGAPVPGNIFKGKDSISATSTSATPERPSFDESEPVVNAFSDDSFDFMAGSSL